MIFEDKPFLTIQWRDDIGSVYMKWKRFIDGEDFRFGLNRGLDLAIEKKTDRWLADLRKLEVVTPEDQAWSTDDWFPRAVAGGVRRMAIIVPESTLAKMAVNAIMKTAENNHRALVTHYFESVDAAEAWLVGN